MAALSLEDQFEAEIWSYKTFPEVKLVFADNLYQANRCVGE